MQQEVCILIVEDDDGHAALAQRNLRRAGIRNEIKRFHNGSSILDFLFEGAGRDDTQTSYLMLLDIRMPGTDGIEVLRRVKEDPHWRNMPVTMLTTTDDPREIEVCHTLGCNNYITKPVEYDDFVDVMKRLGLFLLVVQVPSPEIDSTKAPYS